MYRFDFILADSENIDTLKANIPSPESFKGFKMIPADFEKVIESNCWGN